MAALLVAAHTSEIRADNNAAKTDSIRAELAHATSAADSIRMLYDIYDLDLRNQQTATARSIYDVARRNGMTEVQLDILRQMAGTHVENDTALATIEREIHTLPAGLRRDEALTFTHILQAVCHAQKPSNEDRRAMISEPLKLYMEDTRHPDSLLQRIERLSIISIYLRRNSSPGFMGKLMGDLEDIVDSLPPDLYAVRNLFYNRSAQTYTAAGNCQAAVSADKKLLSIMDDLKDSYTAQGRKFRNYDTNRYISYRRMLANYPALSEREVELFARRIDELTARNIDVANDRASNHLADIYISMARKNYGEALRLVRPAISDSTLRYRSQMPRLLDIAIEASRATGDEATLLKALTRQNAILRQQISDNASVDEFELMHQITKLKDANLQMRDKSHRDNLIRAICAVVLALILAAVIFLLYRRARRLADTLTVRNKELRSERDHLEAMTAELRQARDDARAAARVKTDFIHNMSHEVREPLQAIAGYSQLIVDYITDDNRPYLQNFANIVTINCDLLLTLVNDVLELAEGDHGKLSVELRPANVESMCQVSVESQQRYVQPGVTMSYNPGKTPDLNINTDRRRVEQVLVNLLRNAAKFTPSGSIVLSCSTDADLSHITFAVTDTGIGIPADKHEKIFERFEQLNTSTQGTGLGLNICRLVARLLHGEVWVDPSYTDGARFLFRIPTNIK